MLALLVHPVARVLCLVTPDDTDEVIVLEEVAYCLVRVVVRDLTCVVVQELLFGRLGSEVLGGVRPQHVCHGVSYRKKCQWTESEIVLYRNVIKKSSPYVLSVVINQLNLLARSNFQFSLVEKAKYKAPKKHLS